MELKKFQRWLLKPKQNNKEIMCFPLLPLASHMISPLKTAFYLPLLAILTVVPWVVTWLLFPQATMVVMGSHWSFCLSLSYLQRCPIELSVMMEMFYTCPVQYSSPCHTWLLSTWNVASVTKELNFSFYLFIIFRPCHAACGILVPLPGIKPVPLPWSVES